MKKRFFSKNIMLLLVNLIISAALLTTTSMAWFAIKSYESGTVGFDEEYLDIADSPVLYLLDSDATVAVRLNLTGLAVGSSRDYVFCVSSVGPLNEGDPIPTETLSTGKAILLELAHTDNLGITYEIYNADYSGTQDTAGENDFPFTSQNGRTLYFTKGVKVDEDTTNQYTTDTTDSNVQYDFYERVQVTRSYQFFILHIDLSSGGEGLEKETDVVYLIAKGGYMS